MNPLNNQNNNERPTRVQLYDSNNNRRSHLHKGGKKPKMPHFQNPASNPVSYLSDHDHRLFDQATKPC